LLLEILLQGRNSPQEAFSFSWNTPPPPFPLFPRRTKSRPLLPVSSIGSRFFFSTPLHPPLAPGHIRKPIARGRRSHFTSSPLFLAQLPGPLSVPRGFFFPTMSIPANLFPLSRCFSMPRPTRWSPPHPCPADSVRPRSPIDSAPGGSSRPPPRPAPFFSSSLARQHALLFHSSSRKAHRFFAQDVLPSSPRSKVTF